MKNVFIAIASLFLLNSCSKQELDSESKENSKSTKNTPRSSARLNSPYVPAGYTLSWEDDFDTFNTSNWSIANKDAVSGDLIPGAVGTNLLGWQYDAYITPEDSFVLNGSLNLRNQKRNYTGTSPAGNFKYTTGWINSMHKVYLNKGYIEVRAQFPSGDKVWPALWLCAEDLIWGPEWDIWEYFGQRNDVGYDNMGMHLMTGTYPSTKWYFKWLKPFDVNYNCEAWHTYGFEWTDTAAKWYIDGVLVHTLLASAVTNWPNENMYIILNNSTRTDSPDATTTYPNTLVIDYIQIFKKTTPTFTFSNSGFETGVVSPWATYGISSISNTNMRTGTYCAKIANNSGFEYTITGLVPNASYTLSAYIKSASSAQNVNLAVKNYGGSQIITSTKSTAYELKSITFTTGATNTTALISMFKYANGTGFAYGDDFKLVKN